MQYNKVTKLLTATARHQHRPESSDQFTSEPWFSHLQNRREFPPPRYWEMRAGESTLPVEAT